MSNYGIYVELVASQASTPVSTATTVVIIGAVLGSDASKYANDPQLVLSKKDYETRWGSTDCSLRKAAEVAFDMMNMSQAIFINVNVDGASDEDDISTETIIGAELTQTGCYAIQRIYPKFGLTPDIVVCPLSSVSDVLQAIKINITKANGHWDGICLYDVVESAGQLEDGIVIPQGIIGSKQISNERFIACWGHIKTATGIYSSALYKACLLAVTDAQNHDVPMRSIGNLPAPDVSYITLADDDSPVILTEESATMLADSGITSFINIGSNVYYTWGDGTSALINNTVSDERSRFDTTIRMMLMLGNRFQRKWRNAIDAPMNLGLRKDIITEEQSYLDYLKAIGALLGYPKCEFRPLDNTIETIQRGEFYFTNIITTTPPARYIDLKVGFTSEGYAVLLEG